MWITIIICSFDCWFLFLGSRSCDWTLNRSTCNQNKLVCSDILLCGFGHQATAQAIYILGYWRNKLTSIYRIIIVLVYQLTPNSIFPEHYTPLLTVVQFRILKFQNAHTLDIVSNWGGIYTQPQRVLQYTVATFIFTCLLLLRGTACGMPWDCFCCALLVLSQLFCILILLTGLLPFWIWFKTIFSFCNFQPYSASKQFFNENYISFLKVCNY